MLHVMSIKLLFENLIYFNAVLFNSQQPETKHTGLTDHVNEDLKMESNEDDEMMKKA